MFVVDIINKVMNDNNGQSAAKPLSSNEYEEGSTTISRKESTTHQVLEKVSIKHYRLNEKKFSSEQGVYAIYCLENKKVYVGSCINLHARLIRHKSYLKNKRHHAVKLQRSYDKHGIDSFVVYLIEELKERSQITIEESKWIKKLNSFKEGLNSTEKTINLKPFKLTTEQIEKRIAHSSKPVVCLDLNGTYLVTYKSISDAARAIGDQSTNISGCCKGRLNYIKDFIFVYESEYDKNKNYQLTPREYNFSNDHKQKISNALKGRQLSDKAKEANKLRSSKQINKYNAMGELVKRYKSITECAQSDSFDNRTLVKYIKNNNPLGGFLYRFNEDIV